MIKAKVKGFRYHADKAEDIITRAENNRGRYDEEKMGTELRKAEIYARLAVAAPADQTLPCPGRLIAQGGGMIPAPSRPCALQAEHEGDHVTADGIYFHDWPMRDDE